MLSFHQLHHTLGSFKCMPLANVKSAQNMLQALPVLRIWCWHHYGSVSALFSCFVQLKRVKLLEAVNFGVASSPSLCLYFESNKAETKERVENKIYSGATKELGPCDVTRGCQNLSWSLCSSSSPDARLLYSASSGRDRLIPKPSCIEVSTYAAQPSD